MEWSIGGEGERLWVVLRGDLDEKADLSELKPLLRGHVDLELGGIARVNSCGVREWVQFMRDLVHVESLGFSRCSPAVMLQVNTICNFRGTARIRSFLAPYVCGECRHEEYRLIEVHAYFADHRSASMPLFDCGQCGGLMSFDELPERYLSFLADEGEGEVAEGPRRPSPGSEASRL